MTDQAPDILDGWEYDRAILRYRANRTKKNYDAMMAAQVAYYMALREADGAPRYIDDYVVADEA